ncbi:hydrolase [Paenibacillus sp. 1011MAR3C5]|uniref:zinc dependent phospholipase C family protein n=1 Tax=Paenibacillus sp. 1011MAR3C5 TaxID=1675787 RepID=UPI000E6CFEDA|nr:zinc dependent phospholipase C family protein [Paenibacillus sp. 1011MAR3C5]RJE86989.1 hydrolase [Paenibacillus sp. 1011MAR3C5]
MGSRLMHAVIANRIAEALLIEDKPSFLLGSLAPDAVSPKDASHFFTGDIRDYSRSIDYKGFLYQYQALEHEPYIWGYFTHLIADHVWLKGFYLPWLRNRMEGNPEVLQLYHNDFRLLNGKLLDYYGCQEELRDSLSYRPAIADLQEVSSQEVEAFIPLVMEDMAYERSVLDEKLHVFTMDQIVGYIETSVELGIRHLRTMPGIKPAVAT